jgi:hypothetical protein
MATRSNALSEIARLSKNTHRLYTLFTGTKLLMCARPAPAPQGSAKIDATWRLQKVRKILDTTPESNESLAHLARYIRQSRKVLCLFVLD